MKKLISLLLAAWMCLGLCACDENDFVQPVATEPTMLEVHITAGKIEPGMTAKDIFAEVTIENEPVPCRVTLTGFVWDGYWEMEDDEPVSDPVCVRLNVFYSLPKGYDECQINVTMECDGGNYDGTGSISFDEDGNVEAWSHAFYGKEPLPPETEQTETQHTHEWVEQPGLGIVICTVDGVKNFKCSCGETKQEIIPAPGHTLSEWSVTPATCTRDGRKIATCQRCAAGFVVELPATGHSWSAWVKTTGLVHSRTCSTCGETESASHNIPAGSVTCTDCGMDIIN